MKDYEKFKLGNIKLLSGKILKSAQLAYKTYGKLNKTASNAIILPTFYTGSHIRNEGFIGKNRAADMTMNVYLAFSMTLAAAVEGIKMKIHPGKPTDQDLYEMTDKEFKKLGIKRLPRNLLMALEALKNDKLSDEVIGTVMKKSLLAYKNDEWERYHQAVTDWEVKEYLRLY